MCEWKVKTSLNKKTPKYCKMLVNLLKFYLAEYKNIIYSPDHFFFFPFYVQLLISGLPNCYDLFKSMYSTGKRE